MAKGPTAMQVAVSNGGIRKGVWCLNWVLDFGVTEAMGAFAPGQSLSTKAAIVAKERGYSEAKAWRMHRAFRQCLPMFESPSDLISLPANGELRRFLAGMAEVGQGVLDAKSAGAGLWSVSGAAVA